MPIPEKYKNVMMQDTRKLLKYKQKKDKELIRKKEKFYKEQKERIGRLVQEEKDLMKVRKLDLEQREKVLGKRASFRKNETNNREKIEEYYREIKAIKQKLRRIKDIRELETYKQRVRGGFSKTQVRGNSEAEKLLETPMKFVRDEQGRIFDSNNNPITLTAKDVSSVKVNQEKFRSDKIRNMMKYKGNELKVDFGEKVFDENIKEAKTKKRRKALSGLGFSLSRNRKKLENYDIIKDFTGMKMIKKTGKLSDYQIRKKMYQDKIGRNGHVKDIPEMEWWDKPFVNFTTERYMSQTFIKQFLKGCNKTDNKNHNETKIENSLEQRFSLIEKLIQDSEDISKILKDREVLNIIGKDRLGRLPRLWEAGEVKKLKQYPTRDEAKRTKREKKLKELREIQEKIKYGVLPPPESKLKLSTFMSVLKEDALQDPTKVDMIVRKAIKDRQKKHERHNIKRKKQKLSKKEKRRIKAKKDLELKQMLSVYKVRDLANFENQFKINTNARKFFIKGFCLVPAKFLKEFPGVVVTYAGEKFTNKFEKLIMKRIIWKAGQSLFC